MLGEDRAAQLLHSQVFKALRRPSITCGAGQDLGAHTSAKGCPVLTLTLPQAAPVPCPGGGWAKGVP